jgi:biopolymer transport protein ExbD
MAFAPSKGAKHRKKGKQGLILGSMLDMMTVILLFLLKLMGSSGALLRPSPYIHLPTSTHDMKPDKAVSILVSPQGVFEDVEKNPRLLSSADDIQNPNTVVLAGLESFLTEQKDFTEHLGKKFRGVITVQCDQQITYDWLLKVINTCGQAEYGTIDFVVIKKKS